jgi:2-octaprenyl-6-methoxyphenol hydroxylase
MTVSAFPIAILGAGPVGQALALMLARIVPDPAGIVLIHGAPPLPAAPAGSNPDTRVLALNHGSLVLLETLAARPRGAAAIHTIHVSQRGRLGHTVIRHGDFGVPQLGGVAPYPAVREALARAVDQSGITVRHAQGARVVAQDGGGATIRADDGAELRCAVAVVSDGTAGGQLRREYGQDAVLTTVRATRPRPGWAYERFTREGPLALLPHPSGDDCYAVVWCCAPAHATALAALDDADFSRALNRAFGERLGSLSCIAPRHVAPLFMSLRRSQVEGRTVAIGNAAQTLHPVAGQGLNLGLRDAAALAQALAPWLRDTARDPAEALRGYARARRSDRWITAALTDLLPRVFATGLAPVEHACGLALLALDLSSPLRAPLARHLLQGWRA